MVVAVLVAGVAFLVSAMLAARVARIHDVGRRTWHLLVTTPKTLDLSAYSPEAVRLASMFRACWYVAMGSLLIAATTKILFDA